MAVLRIQGKAEKEYQYDVMTVTITFRAKDHSSAKAIGEVMKQSENFLKIFCSLLPLHLKKVCWLYGRFNNAAMNKSEMESIYLV